MLKRRRTISSGYMEEVMDEIMPEQSPTTAPTRKRKRLDPVILKHIKKPFIVIFCLFSV